MYGIEAINANNGWAISVVGISIVFSGLIMLSLIISQLYKILAFWEDPSKIKRLFKAKKPEKQSEERLEEQSDDQDFDPAEFTESQKEAARQLGLLSGTMEEPFSLPRLLHLARISDVKDPCSNLGNLLRAKVIIPDRAGFFTWDKELFDLIERTGTRK